MFYSPSTGRLRTISTRSDLRTEDEIDGQRSTWVVLRMPPLISFVMLCIARGMSKCLVNVYAFAITPWVVLSQVTRHFISILAQCIKEDLTKLKTQPEELGKIKERLTKLELENQILKRDQQNLLNEVKSFREKLLSPGILKTVKE